MVLLPCSKCCGPSEFNCLVLSVHTIGRIIFEAQIESITPGVIDATYECGLWPGIRLRSDVSDITPDDIMKLDYLSPLDRDQLNAGNPNCEDCGQNNGYGPSLLDLDFKAPVDADSADLLYSPVVTFAPTSDVIVGRSLVDFDSNSDWSDPCVKISLPAGWETWQAVGFGDHFFDLEILQKRLTGSDYVNVGTIAVRLRLTDKAAVEDLAVYPSDYFDTSGVGAGQGPAGCSDNVLPEDEYKIIGTAKPDKEACDAFCTSPPTQLQWFQINPCEPELPCLQNGIRVIPNNEAQIDFSGLSAVSWGQFGGLPGDVVPKAEGFSGTLGQANDWLSDLEAKCYYEPWGLQPPVVLDEYPNQVDWQLFGCKEFWQGGPPPFASAAKDFCDATGGNDFSQIFYSDPPDDSFEICGLTGEYDPTKPPRPKPQPKASRVIMSGSCETFGISQLELAQVFSDDGYCDLRFFGNSGDLTIEYSGLEATVTIPANKIRLIVNACRYEPSTDPLGNPVTLISYYAQPVNLEGSATVSFSFNPITEPIGVCAFPDGSCVETDEITCKKSCGVFDSYASLADCQGNHEVDPAYFQCWNFDQGQPPPNYVPAGPIGTDCVTPIPTSPIKELQQEPIVMQKKPKTTGPGTELANLLKWFNIHAKEKGCGCKSFQKKMDRGGPQWCKDHKEEILAHLEKEAKKRGLPFIKLAASKLIDLAIRRSERG